MIESTLIFSYDGYYSAIKKHIFEEYLIIRESSYDKRERQFRKLSIQKDLIFRVFIFLVFWLPFAELAVVFVVNWGHISVITLVLCVRHSCGRADTATLLSPSPNPSDFITRQFHFPTVLPTNCALRDTSLWVLHQPVWCSKLGAPGKVDEDKLKQSTLFWELP